MSRTFRYRPHWAERNTSKLISELESGILYWPTMQNLFENGYDLKGRSKFSGRDRNFATSGVKKYPKGWKEKYSGKYRKMLKRWKSKYFRVKHKPELED